MTSEILQQKAFEIAQLLFNSQELYISRGEFRNHFEGEFEEYEDLVREALCSNSKIIPNKQGRIGGIKFLDEKYRRSSLSQIEKVALGKKVDQLWKDHQTQKERLKRERPEREVEKCRWLFHSFGNT